MTCMMGAATNTIYLIEQYVHHISPIETPPAATIEPGVMNVLLEVPARHRAVWIGTNRPVPNRHSPAAGFNLEAIYRQLEVFTEGPSLASRQFVAGFPVRCACSNRVGFRVHRSPNYGEGFGCTLRSLPSAPSRIA
jgi:hypothetical protein